MQGCLRAPRADVVARTPAPRRAALAALAWVATLAASGAAHAREWMFDVTLDGLSIGSHRFTLREAGDARSVTSDARFRVRLLVIDAYSYDHHAEESWRGDCLASLESRTVERGKTTTVQGRLEDEGFVVSGPRGRENAGACAMTFAYWNPRIYAQQALLNPQTGVPTPIKVTPIAHARVSAQGATHDATGYRIETEKTRIEAYYAGGDWIGMRSTTRDGHVLEYRLR